MSVREIPPAEWPAFLEQFTVQHRAWLASVVRLGPGPGRHVEAVDRPLGSVTARTAGRRVGGIQIRFQQDSRAGGAVRVDAPTRLRVDETDAGVPRALEIEGPRGECTRITLRVAMPPGLLDGVAPGEL